MSATYVARTLVGRARGEVKLRPSITIRPLVDLFNVEAKPLDDVMPSVCHLDGKRAAAIFAHAQSLRGHVEK
ncbi:hypothetical protein ACHAXT_009687 [Thalassiosira profunda]